VKVPVVVLFSRPDGSLPAAIPLEVWPGETPTSGLGLFTNGESGPNDAASVVGPIADWLLRLVDSLRSVSPLVAVPDAAPAPDIVEVEFEDVDVELDAGFAGAVTTGAGDAPAVAGAVETAGAAAQVADAASASRVGVRHLNGDGLRMARLLSDRLLVRSAGLQCVCQRPCAVRLRSLGCAPR
jgi:hypothetical protein